MATGRSACGTAGDERLLEQAYGGRGRGVLRWRCTAALAAAAIGDRERAERLCVDELELVQAGVRAREIGAALRMAAVLDEGERRVELPAEEIKTLASPVLELVRALVDPARHSAAPGAARRPGPPQRALEAA